MAIDATEITQEMIDELKKRMNIVWKPRRPYFNTSATRDTIAHYCDGIGDVNPLFTDRIMPRKPSLASCSPADFSLQRLLGGAGPGYARRPCLAFRRPVGVLQTHPGRRYLTLYQ